MTAGWRRFGQYNTFLKDQKMPACLKRKILNINTTSYDIWSGEVVAYKISERETGCGTKYGEIKRKLEAHGPEWHKIDKH